MSGTDTRTRIDDQIALLSEAVKGLRGEIDLLKALQKPPATVTEFRRCSFCQRPDKETGALISTPSGVKPVAYICEKCTSACVELFKDRQDRQEKEKGKS